VFIRSLQGHGGLSRANRKSSAQRGGHPLIVYRGMAAVGTWQARQGMCGESFVGQVRLASSCKAQERHCSLSLTPLGQVGQGSQDCTPCLERFEPCLELVCINCLLDRSRSTYPTHALPGPWSSIEDPLSLDSGKLIRGNLHQSGESRLDSNHTRPLSSEFPPNHGSPANSNIGTYCRASRGL
jgi:hypothetical protein